MKKLLLVTIAFLALALPAHAQTTVTIPALTAAQGSITIVAIMGTGPTCLSAAPCTFTWTDTFANWQKVGVAYGPSCQAANLVGNPPVPTPCTGQQVFAWWAKTMITGTVGNANSAANQAAYNALVLPTPMAPTTPSVIPNCGGIC